MPTDMKFIIQDPETAAIRYSERQRIHSLQLHTDLKPAEHIISEEEGKNEYESNHYAVSC